MINGLIRLSVRLVADRSVGDFTFCFCLTSLEFTAGSNPAKGERLGGMMDRDRLSSVKGRKDWIRSQNVLHSLIVL